MYEYISPILGIFFGGYVGYIVAKYFEFIQYKLKVLDMLDRHYLYFAGLSVDIATDCFDDEAKNKFTASFVDSIGLTVYFSEMYFLRIGHVKAAWRAREAAVAINNIIGPAVFRTTDMSDWPFGIFKEEKKLLRTQLSEANDEIRPSLLPLLCPFWRIFRKGRTEALFSDEGYY